MNLLVLILIIFTSLCAADNLRSLPECLTSRQLFSIAGDFPSDLCQIDEKRIILLYKNGRILLLSQNGGTWSETKLLELTNYNMLNSGELGLVGCLLSQNFLKDGQLYLTYKALPSGNVPKDTIGLHQIAKFTYDLKKNTIDPTSKTVIFGACKQAGDCPITAHPFHSGGGLAWDKDGNLIFGVGDTKMFEGGDSDQFWKKNGFVNWPQSLNEYRGKIIRIDKDGNGVKSNPFYDDSNPRSAKSRIFANGMRNPWSLLPIPTNSSWNNLQTIPASNNKAIVFDVGFVTRESIKLIGPGTNGGWPGKEGTFTVKRGVDMSGTQGNDWSSDTVLAEYSGPGACIVGGVILEARDGWPASLVDSLIFGDFVRGQLYYLNAPNRNGPSSPPVFAQGATSVIHLKRGTSGTILVIQRDAGTMYVREIYPDPNKQSSDQCKPANGQVKTVTTTLSVTKATTTATVNPSCVNAPLNPPLPTALPAGLEPVTTVTDSGLYSCINTTSAFPHNTCTIKLNARGAPMTSRTGYRWTQGVGVSIAKGSTEAAKVSIALGKQCWALTGTAFLDARTLNSSVQFEAVIKNGNVVLWNSTLVGKQVLTASFVPSLDINLKGLQGVSTLSLEVKSKSNATDQMLWDWANLYLLCGPTAPYLPKVTLASRAPTQNLATSQPTTQKTNTVMYLTASALNYQNKNITTFAWSSNLAHCNGPYCHYHYDMATRTGKDFSFTLLPHDSACLFWEATVWATDSCGRRNRASAIFKVTEAEPYCITTQMAQFR